MSKPLLYLCEKDHHIQPQNSLDIFDYGYGGDAHACNYHLLEMWKRVFLKRERVIFFNYIGKHIFEMLNRFSWGRENVISIQEHSSYNTGLIEKSEIYLTFNEVECAQANSDLEKMRIEKSDSYVCILNRSQDYLQHSFSETNLDYHSFRNCSIDNYLLAAEKLVHRGYHVIRVGSIVGDLMKTDNPKIIEYAHNGYRTELLDIFLPANCYFFVGCGSGPDFIPIAFKRPEVFVNISQLEGITSWSSNCLIIFKKPWIKQGKRFMALREVMELGIGRINRTYELENMGIELVENSPEEILDVVIEMDERLKGTWENSEEDEELQRRFWNIFKVNDLSKVIRARIGTKFLRQNKELLN